MLVPDFFTDPVIQQWYFAWVNHLVNRVNTVTGVPYNQDPTIMAWELMNEPRCAGSGDFPSSGNCTLNYAVYNVQPVAWKITAWVDAASKYVKSVASKQLVSVGDEVWLLALLLPVDA